MFTLTPDTLNADLYFEVDGNRIVPARSLIGSSRDEYNVSCSVCFQLNSSYPNSQYVGYHLSLFIHRFNGEQCGS